MDKITEELVEKLSGLSLLSALDLLEETLDNNQFQAVKRIKDAICIVYQKTPTVIFNQSNKDIDVEYTNKELRDKIISSRRCAIEIVERLIDTVDHIHSTNDIKVIFEQELLKSN